MGPRCPSRRSDQRRRRPFEPWDLDREAALARIGREMAGLDHSPESGEICWLTVP
ncbi:hypothetical protein [Saccharothrix lopnurensis]|uniref:Uncharacterized protein n=1 Tax=Saccharothrix lopnurensis TaxID=1670621 RepID=A0ABW1PDL4_9PSEU